MIPLKIQIPSLIISFFYGVLIFILLEVNSSFIYHKKKYIKILCSLIFVMFISILYFVILLKVNNGLLHIYFFILIILGYFFSLKLYNLLK